MAQDQHAEPAFEQRCMEIIQQWQRGELPFMQASEQFMVLRQEAENAKHDANLGRVEVLMGVMQSHRGNFAQSLEHFNAAYAIFHRLENRQQLVLIDLNIGEIYRNKGDYTRARKKYLAAKEAAPFLQQDANRLHTIAIVNEGLMLINMQQHESARKAFERSLELVKDWDGRPLELQALLCEIHRGLALVHLHGENPSAAWESAQAALSAAQNSRETVMLGYANRAMGEALTALGDNVPPGDHHPDPDHYFQTAYNAFREVNAEGEIGRTMYKHALSLLKRGRRPAASRKLQQATLIFARRGMTQDAALASEMQGQLF